jgi:hypothetical protein
LPGDTAAAHRLIDLRHTRNQLQWSRMRGTAADMWAQGIDVLRLSDHEWVVFHAGVFHAAPPLLWKLMPRSAELLALQATEAAAAAAASAPIAEDGSEPVVPDSSSLRSPASFSSVQPRCGFHPSAYLAHAPVLNLQSDYLYRCFGLPAPVPPANEQRKMYLALSSCNRAGIMARKRAEEAEGFVLADYPHTLLRYYKKKFAAEKKAAGEAAAAAVQAGLPPPPIPASFTPPGVLCMASVWLGRSLPASAHARELPHLLGRADELLMLGYHSIHDDANGQIFSVYNEQQIHHITKAPKTDADATKTKTGQK